MYLEIVVPGIPRTRQTGSPKARQDWKERVRSLAIKEWSAERPPLNQELSAVIVHFYTEATNIDVDGIAKLILDALEGEIYENDSQFSQVTLRRTNQLGLSISNPSPLLADTLGSHDSFVYLRLDDAPDHKELPK